MRDLEAVVFDLDGTLVDSERHGHRVAFNLAFSEAGLPYVWDEDTYGELLRITGGQRRIAQFLGSVGFEPDDIDSTAAGLHRRKTEIMRDLVSSGRVEPRPGARRLLAELGSEGIALAVATTGSRAWVEDLLGQVLGEVEFAAVVCGDEVPTRKPDPAAFTESLRRLGLQADQAVAVEDSGEGLAAARGAGLVTLVVVNGYTADHDLGAANLVVDGFGEPRAPARLMADRSGVRWSGMVDAALVRALSRARLEPPVPR